MAASVVVVFVLVSLASLIALDGTRGDLIGVVKDASGGVVPGVRVTASGPESRSVLTNGKGEFAFINLSPGRYEVRYELAGFATVVARATVAAQRSVRLDATLAAGSLAEHVRVAGEAPVVDSLSARQAVAVAGGIAGSVVPAAPWPGWNREGYAHIVENGFKRATDDPLSTFSIDVDTASYANVRRFLNQSSLPPAGAVRIEEMINYFDYGYPQPRAGEPFSITTELADCPWNPKHRLALIGIRGREVDAKSSPPRNLVFLIDVSGSMQDENKLPLVRNAMRMLVDILEPRDRVAVVVYAGATGVALPSTPGDQKAAIHQAIARLGAGGSTNGAAGIRHAYEIARQNFIRNGVNRVILATDGDFNVGVTSQDELVRLIEKERESGVFLSVLGVGEGNLQDATMERLADSGNGNYSYLDTLHEARKVLVGEASATLTTIAKDVKIQVEFNPRVVGAYRLIGYENRLLNKEDFNNDRKDAGEIGAGHTVTALYEIVPPGLEKELPGTDPLKYQTPLRASGSDDEAMTVKVRYKAPDGDVSSLVTTALAAKTQAMTANIGFASAVAEFGMLLRESPDRGTASYERLAARARTFRGDDPDGYRAEFIKLAELASSLRSLGTR